MEKEQEHAINRFFSSGLKLHHLRILAVLAELKQVKLVADAFHVSQPAVSKHIAEMERALGVDLVRRVGQRIEFTPFGNVLSHRAREILHQLNRARKDFDSLLSGTTGKLSLGVATTVTPVLVPEAIAAFHHRAPNVAVTLMEGTADRLMPLLDGRQLDCVVGRAAAPPDLPALRDMPIATDPLVLVVSRQHPLAFRMTPEWQDLEGSQWVLPSPSSPVFHALERLLRSHGMALPGGGIQSTSLLANAGLIARTALLGLLPRTLAVRYVAEGRLSIVPLDMSSLLERIYLVWHRENDNPALPLMKEALEYCGRIYGSPGRA